MNSIAIIIVLLTSLAPVLDAATLVFSKSGYRTIEQSAAPGDTQVTVSLAPQSTLIGQVAQALADSSPNAPAWSGPVIGVNSINSDVHYWGEPGPGDPIVGGRPPFTAPNSQNDQYNICDWPGKTHWDPVYRDWWYSGGPTGNQDCGSPTMVRYRPGDDKFIHWQGRASRIGGIWPPYGHAHSFDASDIDLKTRRIWRHLKGYVPDSTGNYNLGWFNIDTYESGVVAGDFFNTGAFPTISFMPENRLLHLIFDQSVRRFNVDSMRFVSSISGTISDNAISCYYRGKIYCTKGVIQGFFAILPSGSIQTLAPTPLPMSGEGNIATQSTLCPLGDYIYAFCGNGEIWRYDPAGDTWGSSAYDSIPWLWTYHTYSAPPERGINYMSKSVVGPCVDQGVALYCIPGIWSSSGTTIAKAFVWKP